MTDNLYEMIPAWVDGTLEPVEKLRVHQLGLKHKAVSVFVLSDDQVLIQRRAAGKYHSPGLWANTCCTHPLWNEAPLDCAHRRLDEELGISGLVPVHRDQVEYRANVGGGLIEHEVVDIYLADAPRDIPLTVNPNEVSEVEWVALPDLMERIGAAPEKFTPWLRIYMSEHKERIFSAL